MKKKLKILKCKSVIAAEIMIINYSYFTQKELDNAWRILRNHNKEI